MVVRFYQFTHKKKYYPNGKFWKVSCNLAGNYVTHLFWYKLGGI